MPYHVFAINKRKALLCSLGFSFAVSITSQAAEVTSSAATTDNRAPSLGVGHNSQTLQALPTQCVNGYVSNVSYQETSTFDLIYDHVYESVKSDMKLDGNFNYSYTDAYKADIKYSWATNLKNTNTSISMLFKFQTEGSYEQWTLQAINGSFLNESGQVALAADPSGNQFYVTCGNSFIDSLSKGGSLYVALIVDFNTEWMKKHFEATATAHFSTAYGIYDMKNVIDYTKEKYGESASIRLTALQTGGTTTQVGNLLSLAGGSTGNCLKDESSKLNCFTIIDRLQEYVSGEFAQSLETSPTVLDYNYASYAYLPEIGYQYNPIPAETIQKRKQLSETYLAQLELKSEWESRLSNLDKYGAMLQDRWKSTKNAALVELDKVSANLENLNIAREICYSTSTNIIIQQCTSAAQLAIDNQVAINFPAFPHAVYPFGVHNVTSRSPERTCTIPELSVLTGVDIRIRSSNVEGVRCWYRLLNEDGTLGEEASRISGSGSEAPIRLPYGYVVTGYGFRSKDNNAKTAIVYYRKWDSETRTLVGPTMTKRGGSSPNGGIELDFSTDYDLIRGLNADLNHTLLTGIGARVTEDNASGLRVYLGWIE